MTDRVSESSSVGLPAAAAAAAAARGPGRAMGIDVVGPSVDDNNADVIEPEEEAVASEADAAAAKVCAGVGEIEGFGA